MKRDAHFKQIKINDPPEKDPRSLADRNERLAIQAQLKCECKLHNATSQNNGRNGFIAASLEHAATTFGSCVCIRKVSVFYLTFFYKTVNNGR